MKASRKLAFVLAASDHGTMILNRLDYSGSEQTGLYGVGFDILNQAAFGSDEVKLLSLLVGARRADFGDGVFVIDCGANIGVLTVELAKLMTDWGRVLAIEAQERIFYALAGNIALNNCFNARAVNGAVGAAVGMMKIPVPDYCLHANFGGLELVKSARTENIGQAIDYDGDELVTIPAFTIDSLAVGRLDLMKVDVEGMEVEVLAGAKCSIETHRPIIFAEHVKVGLDRLVDVLEPMGYRFFPSRQNIIAVHGDDPTCGRLMR